MYSQPAMLASRKRSNVGISPPTRSSQNTWANTAKMSTVSTIHAAIVASAARPRLVIAVNRASAPRRTSAASVVKRSSATAAPSANQYRCRPSITVRQQNSSAAAHNAIARIGGPKSGVGTVNTEMPTISSTAMMACVGPTIARPSANTHQYVAIRQICDSA